ncbi:MAG: tRNA uridine-5-carboxymethylaminomethyl(34) synthesis GTPase MnmE [Deltaproteobacteria bacterium]|jgi:tRNA modification GTPase|nr:tRNA uridine-5-carboxymethylaminomethyl(34) synthesis GTPase MnmE [Deltaproteobacteria bacterium]
MSGSTDLIAAIATPQGSGAVSIIRLSGPGLLEALAKILVIHTDLEFHPRSLILGHIRGENGQIIDEVLAVYFPGPNSFTGEDCAEIQGHAGAVVPRLVLAAILEAGARLARPGEFTQRAFLNNRLSLDQAEAVAELVAAQSQSEAVLANRQLAGALKERVNPIAERLISLAASLTVILDFDEPWDANSQLNLTQNLAALRQDLAALLALRREGRIFREGLRIVLAGPPNAGKSSLFNALLGLDRALVSPRPGTTRDYLEASVSWAGVKVELVDTAGLWPESTDELDQLSQDRARAQMGQADLIVWLRDLSAPNPSPPPQEAQESGIPILAVWAKADLIAEPAPNSLAISAKTGQGLAQLKDEAIKLLGLNFDQPPDLVPNFRHQKALEKTSQLVNAAVKALEEGEPPDIITLEIVDALETLGQITGRVMTEDLLTEVFSNFCLGK